MSRIGNDVLIKIMVSLITASAVKMASDIGEIKTSVALAVQRIEQHEARLQDLERRVKGE